VYPAGPEPIIRHFTLSVFAGWLGLSSSLRFNDLNNSMLLCCFELKQFAYRNLAGQGCRQIAKVVFFSAICTVESWWLLLW
jgi:hypothetical protein